MFKYIIFLLDSHQQYNKSIYNLQYHKYSIIMLVGMQLENYKLYNSC